MTDRTELLAAVLADPACDAKRLIYADWLEDHGEAERAEFIRLQCRIAELQRDCYCGACVKLRGGGQHHNGPCAVSRDRQEMPDGTSRQSQLRRHEYEIMQRNKGFMPTSWVPVIEQNAAVVSTGINGAKGPPVYHEYRRGFISVLRGPLAALLEHGPAIVREHPVERVEVMDCEPVQLAANEWANALDVTEHSFGIEPRRILLSNHGSRDAARAKLNAAVLAELRRRVAQPSLPAIV